MNELTTEFHKYDLEEINLEYLKHASDSEKENVLPKTVGGSKVHLLLGIKNTKIQPVLSKFCLLEWECIFHLSRTWTDQGLFMLVRVNVSLG